MENSNIPNRIGRKENNPLPSKEDNWIIRNIVIAQDFIVQSENEQLLVEVQKRTFARNIVTELVAERKRLGLTQQDIADRTGMKAPNVTRIESCRFTPTLDVLERYAMAVGKKLRFQLVDIE